MDGCKKPLIGQPWECRYNARKARKYYLDVNKGKGRFWLALSRVFSKYGNKLLTNKNTINYNTIFKVISPISPKNIIDIIDMTN